MAILDDLPWLDPISSRPLRPKIDYRDCNGKPLYGALQIEGTDMGYPLVEGLALMTPDLATAKREWLDRFGLLPPEATSESFQAPETVESFGFQWSWDTNPRSEEDLRWRVVDRFRVIDPSFFRNKLVLDAGCGAGDQSVFLLNAGATVVSVDLSVACEVAQRKLSAHTNSVVVRGDITRPFLPGVFDHIYCEGVIQSTRNSKETVRALCHMLKPGGTIAATHYMVAPSHYDPLTRRLLKLRHAIRLWLRGKLSRLNHYRLLYISAILASLAYIPLVGRIFRETLAVYNPRMHDFKSTWCCTYDYYGSHAYQRYIDEVAFRQLFEDAGCTIVFHKGTVIVARKQ